jgi:hypothetical protein
VTAIWDFDRISGGWILSTSIVVGPDGVTRFRTTACRLVGELGKTGCGSKALGRHAVPKEARDEHRTRIFLAGSRFCTYFKG